jgi:hypothetical protein
METAAVIISHGARIGKVSGSILREEILYNKRKLPIPPASRFEKSCDNSFISVK